MPMNTVWLKSDGVQGIDLDNAAGEVILDFSGVERIDARALRALESLASSAEEKAVKVVMRSVGVEVYKVFKLTGLDSRFSFRT